MSISLVQVRAEKLAGAPYSNSWLGNSFGMPDDHIAHTIDNLYVTPDGDVATITEWDEGGANAALYDSDGVKMGVPVQSGTGSWGRISGKAVFVDGNYLYQSMSQDGGYDADVISYPADPDISWKCIRRYFHNGTAAPFPGGKGYDRSMLVIDSSTSSLLPAGVIVYNDELYVSDPNSGKIKVYNAITMSSTPVRSFSIPNPGLLDFDRLGYIWMLDKQQRKLIRFSTTGVLQPQSITLPVDVGPTGFCLDKINDRVLVSNDGVAQNILIYTSIFTTAVQSSTFGITNGINSGTVGVIAPLKLSEPNGVGIDNLGNIYVGNNGAMAGGARLEKYNSSGALLWHLSGIVFTDNGSLNPIDETEFYTKEFKFNLNLSKTVPGKEWSLAAMTLNRFKYPNDSRLPTNDDNFWTTAYCRNVLGKKLLYVSSMEGGSLAVYRFNAATDGETAIPSGFFDSGTIESIWLDANGNATKDPSETESREDNWYSSHIFPDVNGGVWKTNRDHPTAKIRYFPLEGFDAHGNPLYSFASSIPYALNEIFEVKRCEYDAVNDVMYVMGNSSDKVQDEWWAGGDRLVRYNSFKTANRTVAWSLALPFNNYIHKTNAKAFCEAGDYVFIIAAQEGIISVHSKATGVKIGEILPSASTGNHSGWADINGAIRATRRANGEYLIFAEENHMGKIMMYRWTPGSGGTGLVEFRKTHRLPADGSKDRAKPAGDGVSNLLKYAFNMIGTGAGKRATVDEPNDTVVTARGKAGLPRLGKDSKERLTVTYIRRKSSSNPGIAYKVFFRRNMQNGAWEVSSTAKESVTSINPSLERVVVTETSSAKRYRFAQVKVIAK